MGEIARCVCNLENFESGRVEGRVEIGFKKIELEYSDLRGILNSIFGRVKSSFTRLVPYTRLVEGMDTLSSRDTRASSSFKVLELEKNEYRVWHSRKNSPMAGLE